MRSGTRSQNRSWRLVLLVLIAALVVACGDDDGGGAAAAGDERPTVVVSHSILADVVENLAGDLVDVVVVMPAGVDPHDFQPSARQVDQIVRADALIVNGAGFEEGLLDVFESAADDGVPIHEAISVVDTLGGSAHEHGDEHGGDGHDDEAESTDPHFFADPVRMVTAAEGIIAFLGAETGLDSDRLADTAAPYLAELRALDAEVETLLAPVPDERRLLVTSHEVFGYFADRYDFDVVGVLVEGGSTTESVSASALDELADRMSELRVPTVFTDASGEGGLADTLADEVGGVEVVPLFTESLGEPGSGGETYLDLVRTNATRIAEALT